LLFFVGILVVLRFAWMRMFRWMKNRYWVLGVGF
jgi:hypothetical protein